MSNADATSPGSGTGHNARKDSCTDCPSGELTGIHWPADPDGFDPPEDWSWVERCDSCQRHPDDESAAKQLNGLGHGTEHRYFDRETLEDRSANTQPLELEGCSVAVNVPAPADLEGESASAVVSDKGPPRTAQPAEYHVTWEIDLRAGSPRHAAEQAMAIHRDPASLAAVFDVLRFDVGSPARIDLAALEADEDPRNPRRVLR